MANDIDLIFFTMLDSVDIGQSERKVNDVRSG